MARRASHHMDRVYEGQLYKPTDTHNAVCAVGSRDWFQYLMGALSFYYASQSGMFTARKEQRRYTWFWWAYRRVDGKLYKTYLGAGHELTLEVLEAGARRLSEKAGVL